MKTTITIYRPGAAPELRIEDMPEQPGYRAIAAYVEPLLDGANLERVNVLNDNRETDMFVDEMGQLKGLPRNDEATKVYRRIGLLRHPGIDPEMIPFIAGTAVLFHRKVWR